MPAVRLRELRLPAAAGTGATNAAGTIDTHRQLLLAGQLAAGVVERAREESLCSHTRCGKRVNQSPG